ncbi:unnamed protein product, partial [Ectocarpus sp. 12 AP-2014]
MHFLHTACGGCSALPSRLFFGAPVVCADRCHPSTPTVLCLKCGTLFHMCVNMPVAWTWGKSPTPRWAGNKAPQILPQRSLSAILINLPRLLLHLLPGKRIPPP